MAHYADAIGQLSPNERIMVIYNENARNNGHYLTVRCDEEKSSRTMPKISAEVKREDLASYRAGNINRKELESRIQINRENAGKESYAEYKVFAGILESLYPVSQEASYRVRNISYHHLPNLGVIYLVDMNLRREVTAYVNSRSGESWTVTERGKEESAQVKTKEEAYQQFKKDIRETLLDYGRTLRNLSPEQVILLSVALPSCEDCQVPKRATVSVKKSVLESYEQNQISRERALEAITISER